MGLTSATDVSSVTSALFRDGAAPKPVHALLLSRNALQEVPVGWMIRRTIARTLTRLDLSFNQLTSLPAEIVFLSALRTLEVHCNALSSFPSQLERLPNLANISAHHNRVASLPDWLARCTSLERVELAGNPLAPVIQLAWKQPRALTQKFSNMQLSHIPLELFSFCHITELYLNDNQLVALPHEIASLSRLCILDLRNNLLSMLPWQLGTLTRLTSLRLSHNPLTHLPASARSALCGDDVSPSALLLALRALKDAVQSLNRYVHVSLSINVFYII